MKKTISLVMVVALILIVEAANADFTFSEPVNLGPNINTTSSEGGWVGLSISADELSIYFDDDRSGGYGSGDLWVATRVTTNDEWGASVNLGPLVNSSSMDSGPSISADGLSLYFNSNRGGYGGVDLFVAKRETTSNDWGTPSNLGSVVNSSDGDYMSYISVDGLSLYISSERPGGSGKRDLWVSTRASKEDEWGGPVNLGPTINTEFNERRMWISSDGLMLMFQSDRPRGTGYVEIYMTTRATTNDDWNEPVKLGPPVNLTSDISPVVSSDGRTLYFSSYGRDGGYGVWDLWQARIIPTVDFDGDGNTDALDLSIMVDHWGEDYQLCDIGPMPWGDGIVDVQDLTVLSDHFLEGYPLKAYWKLDEIEGDNAHDSVGDHDGTLNGNPFWQPEYGAVGGSLMLDGIDDYIDTPFILDPTNGSFSVFAWINCWSPGQVIISQEGEFGETWLGTDSSGKLMTGLVTKKIGWVTPRPLISESVITDIQWHHVGFVWDGSYRVLYVDGIEVAKDENAQNPLKSAEGGLYIGASKDLGTGTFFSGFIDDVRIYKQALTAEEIAAMAQ